MKRMALGVALATLAMFVWGMVYWGANPLPYRAWRRAADDAAAQDALRAHFPRTGTYFVPAIVPDAAALDRRYAAGPIAFVHVTSQGRPVHDPSIMIKGLLLDLGGALAMALLLKMAAPALPTYGRRVGFALVAAVGAAWLIDGGDAAWWSLAWDWKLHQALYSATVWMVAGLVLARFVDGG